MDNKTKQYIWGLVEELRALKNWGLFIIIASVITLILMIVTKAWWLFFFQLCGLYLSYRLKNRTFAIIREIKDIMDKHNVTHLEL